MGLGALWDPNEHPRGWHGRFVKKFTLAPWLKKVLDNFNPRQFQSNNQAAQYAQNRGREAPGGMFSPEHIHRIHADWDEAQDALRAGKIDPTTQKFVDAMNPHMQPTKEGLILSKTFTPDALGLRPENLNTNPEDPNSILHQIGNTITDRGFSAVHLGTNDNHGPGKITMTIAASPGTRVAFSGMSGTDRGVFMDRNQKLLVTHVDPDGQGGWYMMAVAEPQGATTGSPETLVPGRKGAGLSEAQREAKIVGVSPTAARAQGAAPPSAPPQQAMVSPSTTVEPGQAPAPTPAKKAARAARQAGYQQARANEGQPPQAAPAPVQAPTPAPAPPEAPPTTPNAPPGVPQRTEPVHGPIGGTPTGGKSASEIATPPPAPTPAPAPAVPAPNNAATFKQEFRARGLQSPSAGPQRKEFNNALMGVSGGKVEPTDALRELDADIEKNDAHLKTMAPDDPKAQELKTNVQRQKELADFMAQHFDLPRTHKTPEAAPAAVTEAPKAPAPAKAAAKVAKAAPKARKFAAPEVGPGQTTRGGPHGVQVGDEIKGQKVASITKSSSGRFEFNDGEGKLITSIAPQGKVEWTKAGAPSAPEKKAGGFATVKNLSPEERKAYDNLNKENKAKYLARRRAGQSHEQALREHRISGEETRTEMRARVGEHKLTPAEEARISKSAAAHDELVKAQQEKPFTKRQLETMPEVVKEQVRKDGGVHAKQLADFEAGKAGAPVKAAKAATPAAPKAVSEVQGRADAAGLPNTVTGLRQQAREKKIRGFSTMSKEQLQRALLGEEVPKAEKALVSPEKLGPHIQAAKTENDAKALMADHTLADLRNLGKANGVDLKGKRTKPQVQDAILKHLRGEETTGIKPVPVTESLDSELKKASVVTPDGPEGDGIRKALSEVDQNDPASLRKERDNLEKEAARLRQAGDRPAAHLAQGAADVLGMRAQRISGVEEAAPAKKIEKVAPPAGHEDLGGTKNDLLEIAKREGTPHKQAMTKPQLIKAITDHRAGKEPPPAKLAAKKAAAPAGELHLGEAKGRSGKLTGRAAPVERIPGGPARVQPQGVRETPAPGAEFTPEQLRRLERNGIKPGGGPTAARQEKIASALHEDWRKTRLQPDGTFEPRVKTTKDEAWIKAHGTDQVDIANTSYKDLPKDWQAENGAAGKVIEGIISRHGGHVDLNNEKTRLQVGEEIHAAWLSRNEYAKGGPLDVPFKDLPPDEQAKDLDQITIGEKVLGAPKAPSAPKVAKAAPGAPAKKAAVAKEAVAKAQEAHPGASPAAVKATRAKVAKAVPEGSVGTRGATPIDNKPRASEFDNAYKEFQRKELRASGLTRPTTKSMDEIANDVGRGHITPEEGIRRVESEIELNNNEIQDINRTLRTQADLTPDERKKLEGQRNDLMRDTATAENMSKFMHGHFGKERVTPEEVKAKITETQGQSFWNELNKADPEALRQELANSPELKHLGPIEGNTPQEVFQDALKKVIKGELEKRAAKKAAKAAPRAVPEPKPEFAPGGTKHLDAKAIAGDLSVPDDVINGAQEDLNQGKSPAQVAKNLRNMSVVRRTHAAYIGLGEPDANLSPERRAERARAEEDARRIDELANRIQATRRPIVRKAAPAKAAEEHIAEAQKATRSPAAKKALGNAEQAVKQSGAEADALKARIIKRHSDAWDGADTREKAQEAANNMRSDLTLAEIRQWAAPQGITGRSKEDILKKAIDRKFGEVTPRKSAVESRMERASRARGVARSLADIEELKANQASANATSHRIKTMGKANGLDEGLINRLHAAGMSNNRSELDKIAQEHGLTRMADQAGTVVPYNPRLHDEIGTPGVREGQPVRVISPGYEGNLDNRPFTAVKARVQHEPEVRAREVAAAERLRRPTAGEGAAVLAKGGFNEPPISGAPGSPQEKARMEAEKAANLARLQAAKVAVPEKVGAGSSLEGRTAAELRQIAKDEDIPVKARATKPELLTAIQTFRNRPAEAQATRGFRGSTPETGVQTAPILKTGEKRVVAKATSPTAGSAKAGPDTFNGHKLTSDQLKVLDFMGQGSAGHYWMNPGSKAADQKAFHELQQMGFLARKEPGQGTGVSYRPNDEGWKVIHARGGGHGPGSKAYEAEQAAKAAKAAPVTPEQAVNAPAPSAPVKTARIRDFGPEVRAKVGRDDSLKLPNGGADQGIVHMDSSIGSLWQDLASDSRASTGTVNEVLDIGHNLGQGKIDLPTARALIRGIKTDNPAIRERINKTVAELDVKPQKYQVPENTPKAIRDILDKLNEIPAYHNKAPGQAGGSGETPFQKIVDLVHAIGNGDEGPGGDMKLMQAIQNPHESGDGVYAARKLAHPIAPGGSQSPEVRNWFRSWRNKGQAPNVEVTPPRNTDAALARERATKAAKKAAPAKVTQAEIKSPVAKVGAEAPKETKAVTTTGLVEGEGIPISNRLALENKLSNRNTLNAMDRAVRHEGTRNKVPELFQTLMTQLTQAGVGPNDEPRKSLIAWYNKHFS